MSSTLLNYTHIIVPSIVYYSSPMHLQIAFMDKCSIFMFNGNVKFDSLLLLMHPYFLTRISNMLLMQLCLHFVYKISIKLHKSR